MNTLINLQTIVQNWLWETLVEQSNFTQKGSIFYKGGRNSPKEKDYILFYFNTFSFTSLQSLRQNTQDNKTIVKERQSCTLSITYFGINAYAKLNDIAFRIRNNNPSKAFEKQNNINSSILNLIALSSLLQNNIKESANLDLSLKFFVESETELQIGLEDIDINSIKLF